MNLLKFEHEYHLFHKQVEQNCQKKLIHCKFHLTLIHIHYLNLVSLCLNLQLFYKDEQEKKEHFERYNKETDKAKKIKMLAEAVKEGWI